MPFERGIKGLRAKTPVRDFVSQQYGNSGWNKCLRTLNFGLPAAISRSLADRASLAPTPELNRR